jgi:type VI protein secretion system component VasF
VNILRRVGLVVMCLLLAVSPILAVQAPQKAPGADGFVPADTLAPVEQLPAAPLVIGAYACFLVLMVGYAWSIARRLTKVEAEMRALEGRSRPR